MKEDRNSTDAFIWGYKEQAAFEILRKCLITPPVVAFPDFNKEFIIFNSTTFLIQPNPPAYKSALTCIREVIVDDKQTNRPAEPEPTEDGIIDVKVEVIAEKNHQRLETAASITDAHVTFIAGRARTRGGAYPRTRASSYPNE